MSDGAPLPDEPRHESVRYEPTDLSLRSVLVFYGALAIVLVVVAGGLWWFTLLLANREAEEKRTDSPWAIEERSTVSPFDGSRETRRETAGGEESRLPSLPRLEGLETERVGPATIQEQYRQADEHLKQYGWVDRKAGVVHIPVEAAMKKLAGRLPARDGKDVDEFLETPSRASSGRVPIGGER